MAIRGDALNDQLNRSTNLPTNNAFTLMGWFLLSANRGTVTSFLHYGSASSPRKNICTSNGVILGIWNGSAMTTGSTLSLSTWYHIAFTFNGTTPLGYLNGALNITAGNDTNLPTTLLCVGGSESSPQWMNGRYACVKCYSAVLTATEIAQEMRQYVPFRMANLNCWSPFLQVGDVTDKSTNKNDWTIAGTLATEDGPPIPWVVAPPRLQRRQAAVAAVVRPRTPLVLSQAIPRAALA